MPTDDSERSEFIIFSLSKRKPNANFLKIIFLLVFTISTLVSLTLSGENTQF